MTLWNCWIVVRLFLIYGWSVEFPINGTSGWYGGMVTRACLRYAREGQNVTQAGPKCHTSRAKMSHKGQNVTQSCYNMSYRETRDRSSVVLLSTLSSATVWEYHDKLCWDILNKLLFTPQPEWGSRGIVVACRAGGRALPHTVTALLGAVLIGSRSNLVGSILGAGSRTSSFMGDVAR